MSKEILIPLDLNQLEIQNFALQNLASDPGSPVAGQVWFDSDNSYPKVYDGAADIELKGAGHSLDEFAAPTNSVAFNSQEITGLSDPTDAQDAATKDYVDGTTSAAVEVQDEGTQVVAEASILDFGGSDFAVTNPAGSEAEIALTSDFVTIAGYDVSLGGSQTLETSDLTDFDTSDATAGQLAVYNGADAEFVNAPLTAGSGVSKTEGDGNLSLSLTNETISLTGGNGISTIGSIPLGGSETVGIATDGVAGDEIDLSIDLTWTGAHTFNGGLDAGGNRLTSVADPTNETDATNKSYVDSLEQGLELKDSVEAATDGTSIDLGSTTDPNPIDGVTLSDGDRVLLIDQSTETENGIYVASTATDPTTWNRSPDADEDSEIEDGMYTWVEQGTANADTGFVLTTNNPELGTDALTFTTFTSAGEYLGGAGLTKDNKTFAVGAGYGITANTDTIDADVAKYTKTIGDGESTSITINHNLGTQDVEVAVRETASPYAFVDCQVEADSVDNASLTFADAPATDAYQAVVIG